MAEDVYDANGKLLIESDWSAENGGENGGGGGPTSLELRPVNDPGGGVWFHARLVDAVDLLTINVTGDSGVTTVIDADGKAGTLYLVGTFDLNVYIFNHVGTLDLTNAVLNGPLILSSCDVGALTTPPNLPWLQVDGGTGFTSITISEPAPSYIGAGASGVASVVVNAATFYNATWTAIYFDGSALDAGTVTALLQLCADSGSPGVIDISGGSTPGPSDDDQVLIETITNNGGTVITN